MSVELRDHLDQSNLLLLLLCYNEDVLYINHWFSTFLTLSLPHQIKDKEFIYLFICIIIIIGKFKPDKIF